MLVLVKKQRELEPTNLMMGISFRLNACKQIKFKLKAIKFYFPLQKKFSQQSCLKRYILFRKQKLYEHNCCRRQNPTALTE